jgi:hypothetical protein
MFTFEDLQWRARPVPPEEYHIWIKQYPKVPDFGVYALMQFSNGYGVQVARGSQTIGGPELFEVRVLDSEGKYCDTTSVANGAVGNLNIAAVTNYMSQIQSL